MVGQPEVEGEEWTTWAEIGGGVGWGDTSEPQSEGSIGWPAWRAAIDGEGARPDKFEEGDSPKSLRWVLPEKVPCPNDAAGSELRDGGESKM
ncbi:MAG: hypothetical protein AB7P08_18250 [Burkholderiales bacterium]